MGIWGNAFKLPEHPEPCEADKLLLAELADKLRGRRMELLAALAVESTKPLHGLGSQALVFLAPLIGAVFGRERAEKAVALLENPKAVNFFIDSLNGEKNVQKRP